MYGRMENFQGWIIQGVSENLDEYIERISKVWDKIKGTYKYVLGWVFLILFLLLEIYLIISQNIRLYFPAISITETIARMYIFSPVAVVGFVLVLLAWTGRKKIILSPLQYILASLALSGGYALVGYLLTYILLDLAVAISFAAAAALNIRIMGGKVLIPVVLFSLVPLTFILVGNTGLLLCILGLITLFMLGK